jgi:hypothetical protein
VTRKPLAKRRRRAPPDPFDKVREAARTLPDVEATRKYDGSPVLKLGGCFLAGLAMDPAAEPDTLVVRVDPDQREWLLDEAPDTYYLTDYHARYPVVLVRLSRVDDSALRDLLSSSWKLTMEKAGRTRRARRRRRKETDRRRRWCW